MCLIPLRPLVRPPEQHSGDRGTVLSSVRIHLLVASESSPVAAPGGTTRPAGVARYSLVKLAVLDPVAVVDFDPGGSQVIAEESLR